LNFRRRSGKIQANRGTPVATAEQQDELVVVRTYAYRHEAEVGRSLLEGHKVDAMISGDDAGGVQPGFGAATGVRLLVKRRDEHKARQLLGRA
jgi:hypothetical protein